MKLLCFFYFYKLLTSLLKLTKTSCLVLLLMKLGLVVDWTPLVYGIFRSRLADTIILSGSQPANG